MTGPSTETLAVRMRGISRRCGDVQANQAIDLDAAVGTVHALIGENGAGKSTLMRILAGVDAPDAGSVEILGQPLRRADPREASRLGVGMVHQHFMLVEPLTVAENLVLGHEPTRAGLLDEAAARAAVRRLSEEWGLSVDPDARIADLSVGERQRVEILRVLYQGARVLILDEPTAVLSPPEVTRLLAMIRRFVAAGGTVLLITHKLDEVMAVADTITVLRRGERVAVTTPAATDPAGLAHLMVGRPVTRHESEERPTPEAPPILEVDGLGLTVDGVPRLVDLTFRVRPGEILGVAGVMGNGQTELLEVLAGLRPATSGRVRFDGADLAGRDAGARRDLGIGHVPEDRGDRGLIGELTIEESLLLGWPAGLARRWALDLAAVRRHAAELITRFDVRPATPTALVGRLSGGNAQKVVLAREVDRRPRVLLCGQPTRGVDVGAIEAIHAELRRLRDEGVAIVLVSAELDEIRALSDRVLVLHRGRSMGELPTQEATPERVGEWMMGVRGAA